MKSSAINLWRVLFFLYPFSVFLSKVQIFWITLYQNSILPNRHLFKPSWLHRILQCRIEKNNILRHANDLEGNRCIVEKTKYKCWLFTSVTCNRTPTACTHHPPASSACMPYYSHPQSSAPYLATVASSFRPILHLKRSSLSPSNPTQHFYFFPSSHRNSCVSYYYSMHINAPAKTPVLCWAYLNIIYNILQCYEYVFMLTKVLLFTALEQYNDPFML
jgi:hypothetical protein